MNDACAQDETQERLALAGGQALHRHKIAAAATVRTRPGLLNARDATAPTVYAPDTVSADLPRQETNAFRTVVADHFPLPRGVRTLLSFSLSAISSSDIPFSSILRILMRQL